MSLILEALNKAERERSSEGSYHRPALLPGTAGGARKWWGFGIALAAVGVGLSAAYHYHQPTPATVITTDSRPQAAIQTPKVAKAPSSTPTPSDHNAESKPKLSPPPAAKREATQNARLHSLAATSDAPATTGKSTKPSSSPVTPTAEKKPSPTVSNAPSSPASTASPPINNEHATAPLLRNLPATLRAQIPPLELNVHVYASDPNRRFVYINSQRHVEGNDIGNGITLVQITRNGIVLKYQATHFRLQLKT